MKPNTGAVWSSVRACDHGAPDLTVSPEPRDSSRHGGLQVTLERLLQLGSPTHSAIPALLISYCFPLSRIAIRKRMILKLRGAAVVTWEEYRSMVCSLWKNLLEGKVMSHGKKLWPGEGSVFRQI